MCKNENIFILSIFLSSSIKWNTSNYIRKAELQNHTHQLDILPAALSVSKEELNLVKILHYLKLSCLFAWWMTLEFKRITS